MNKHINWVVTKYGGTSVSSSEALKKLVERVNSGRKAGDNILVVVSALSGVSNLLESVCETPDKVVIEEIVSQLETRHLNYCDELSLSQSTKQKVLKLLHSLSDWYGMLKQEEKGSFFASQARIMALGEHLSSTIVSDYLASQLTEAVQLIDSTEWLVSRPADNSSVGDQYLNAHCTVEPSSEFALELEKQAHVVVAQGFIAANPRGETVLLGRGGSDTSAAYFATLVGARRLEIWTDVPGMFSANPRSIPAARQLLNLDYREAQEIASTGAKVLHPRCLRPARQAQIPVFVGSATAPEQGGTLIGDVHQAEPQVKAISVREGVLLVAMETADMWQTPGFLAEAFNIFYQHGLSIDQVSTSETNVTVTLDNLTQGISAARIDLLVADLSKICRVDVKRNCAAVSIVGREVRTLLSQLSTAFEAFQNRSVHMLTQAANNLNFTFVIEQNDVEQIVQKLHDALISDNQSSSQLGATWLEITGKQSELFQQAFSQSWWAQNPQELERLAEQGPCFVYSKQKVTEQISELKKLRSIDRVFYAMKANSFPDLLRLVEAEGLGFECVSIAEVKFIFSLFPDIRPERILFTPNFAPRSEYQDALELNVNLTLDNLYPLNAWGDMFRDKAVLLRIDTGAGRGHHQHVKTAGAEAKFGIPLEQLESSLPLIERLNLKVKGLHCHVGSGILTPENWYENGELLKQLAGYFPKLESIDLGGGLGVVEKPEQSALNLAEMDRLLVDLKQQLNGIELWLEPGRFISAESGALLAKVTQLKGKGRSQYVGVETGMNSLIRPALYGAYHPIVNLTRLQAVADTRYTVVGPICETGDKLGVDRLLPECFEGDVILIANAGAYGRVMSSNYNLREPAREVMI